MSDISIKQFHKLVLTSVLLIYLVIAAGGIVRSTGSGMGCPDWPKCFGMWVPPTHISQLPPDYKEVFKVGKHHIADFNAFKTWIEYINRLLGVLVGISVFVTAVYAVRFLKTNSRLFYLAALIVILTAIQGYIGAKVVATNLSEYMITIHMLVALLILSLAVYLLFLTQSADYKQGVGGANTMLILTLLTFLQILVGTQVREGIDQVALSNNNLNRDSWIDALGAQYSIHRVIAVGVVIANIWFSFRLLKQIGASNVLGKLSLAIVAILVLEYSLGVVMARFGIPAFAQPLHLLLATILFGFQFYSWLIFKLQVGNINAANA